MYTILPIVSPVTPPPLLPYCPLTFILTVKKDVVENRWDMIAVYFAHVSVFEKTLP